MNRRNFLRSLGISTAALAVAPQLLFAQSKEPQSATINLEVLVDEIDGDFLSRDYHSSGEKSIIHQSLELTREFYSDMGQYYGLHGVDIKFVKSSTGTIPNDDNFRFHYTTLDKFMERIENDPNLVENIKGKKVADESRQKGSFYLDLDRQMLIRTYHQEAGGAGGACIPGTREIFLFSKDWYNQMNANDPKIRNNAIALLRYTNGHELAHVFGLDHVENIPENEYNIMIPHPPAETVLSPKLNQEQVKTVLAYFK